MSCSSHNHNDGHSCSCTTGNPSVHQTLDELGFERSIFQAAIDNNVNKIEDLSRKEGFDVNATDSYGYTALHYASRNGSLEAAKYLVKLGAKVNLPTGSLKATALHRAVTANKGDMVKYLLSIGADPHIQDSDGLSSLDRARKDNRTNIIQLFQPNKT